MKDLIKELEVWSEHTPVFANQRYRNEYEEILSRAKEREDEMQYPWWIEEKIEGILRKWSGHKSIPTEEFKDVLPRGLPKKTEEQAKERAKEPAQDEGLREELKCVLDGLRLVPIYDSVVNMIDKVISHHPSPVDPFKKDKPLTLESVLNDEPLAVKFIKSEGGNAGFHVHEWGDGTWEIECAAKIFKGKTYAEAESKAREYLNGLPDAGKGKGEK